jgi:tetratricopeptide (TPR) repeat protein
MNLALRNADKAFRLQPELPEAQLAKGLFLYGVSHEYDAALPYFQKASATMPGNIDALTSIAAIDRRQGRWEKAVNSLVDAAELAPSDPKLQFNLAGTYLLMRDYDRAAQTIEAALLRNPKHPMLQKLKGELYLVWKGNLGPMKEDLADRPPIPSADALLYDKIQLLLYERRFDEALKVLKESSFTLVDGEALYFTRDMLQGEILTQAGRLAEAKASWEMDLPQLAQSVAARPKDAGVRLAYALALSGTGQHEKAVSEAKIAIQQTPLEVDALNAPFFLYGLALIQSRAGNAAEAKALLDTILKVPSEYSAARLRASPTWASTMF